jgi:ligand-binding sensor domain-containing protein
MKLKFTLILVYIAIRSFVCYTQNFEPIFKNVADELPSYQVYDMYQDSIGYMWITTDNGIARYDGNQMLNINTQKYFDTKVIFNFYEISPHKVWVNTDINELYWFDPLSKDFKFHPYKYNDILSNTIDTLHNLEHVKKIYFMKDNAIKATFLKGPGYIQIDNKGNSNIYGKIKHNLETHQLSELILKQKNNFYYTYFKNGKTNTFCFQTKNKKQVITANYNYSNIWLYGISDIVKQKSSIYILSGKYLIKKTNDKIETLTIPSEGLDLLIDENTIYVSSFSGVYIINKNLKITNHYLKNKIVTSILKDKKNGFWFSTLENGIFYTKNIDLKKISNINYMPKNIIIKNNHLIVINNKSVMTIFDLKGKLLYEFTNVYLIGPYIISKQKLPKIVFSDTYFYRGIDRMYVYLKNKPIRHLYSDKFYKKKWNVSNNQNFVKVSFLEKIDSYLNLNDSISLILNNNKIIKYNIYTQQKFIIGFDLEDDMITSFDNYRQRLFITTKHHLFVYKILPNFHFKYYTKFYNYDNFSFLFENDSTAWAFNKNMIKKFVYKNKQLEQINYTNNFPFSHISSLIKDKSKLWIGSKEGVSFINIKDLNSDKFNINKNDFRLDSIQINNQNQYFINDTINITSYNSITLYYKYLSFQQNKPLKFEYKLDKNEWLQTNENNLFLQNLSLGYHQLKIKVENKVLFSQVIYVKPIFTQTIWFYLLIIILISFTLFILFKWRLNYKFKKQKEEVEKLNLELKLLNSQMNPHFMFNTINSIQLYILEKSKQQAIQYLSDFAKLIRQSLDFSFNEFILLKDELQFLNRYIELENKRFNDSFVLELEISKKIDINLEKIPSFIIQPIIENVIQHSNYGNEIIKKISLTIEKNDDALTIKVTDFGIQEHIKTRNINKHKSYGLDIIKNRLKIYNGKKFKETDILIEKSFNETFGFSVTLKIYLHEYNYS